MSDSPLRAFVPRHGRLTPCVVLLLAVLLVLATAQPISSQEPPWATVWPVAQPRILKDFDAPDPDWQVGHRGIDLAASQGDPVRSPRSGTLTWQGSIAGVPSVVVAHGAARATYQPVEPDGVVGQAIPAGSVIGRVSAGGHCDSVCLHWGLKLGERYLDPRLLLPGTRVVLTQIQPP
ncbi:MAG: M23 family metallopeptidase [Candidatus Nanopelagicales bacterium]|nr:M23 family metallopeptidase [Candidatus Nanopelagicales bacterium]